jgi:hypothetical protein
MNETELLRLTQYVANQLKSKFQFDIYDQDDIEQEIYFLILEAAKDLTKKNRRPSNFFTTL